MGLYAGSHDLFHWDSSAHSWSELIYELKPRGRVVAYLAPGHTFDERVLTATFYQNKPGIIDAVSFNLEPQTLDEAFNSAMKFAREWNLPTEPLVKWLENAHSGRFEYAQTIRNDLRPTIAVEVFKTYDHDKPFRVMLQVGWPFWDEPATSQSTPG
jgi:hypothetical protein